jgi:hypothetical protein
VAVVLRSEFAGEQNARIVPCGGAISAHAAAREISHPLECAMLLRNGEPRLNMKSSHNSQARRTARRGPWHAKNIRLLRAALRVWELKQRTTGRL